MSGLAHVRVHPRVAQRGGIISLLLGLLAIGVLTWLMLKRPSADGGTDTAQALSCERDNSRLIAATGGLGEAYRAGYDRLPLECRKLLPAPGANDPSPEHVPDT